MHEATDALNKSKNISKALSSFFNDYDQVTDRIKKLISEAEKELLILVSLPAYGTFVNERLGDVFYESLTDKLVKCANSTFEIQFICFDRALCSKYEKQAKITIDINKFDKYMMYKRQIIDLISDNRTWRKKKDDKYENIWLLPIDNHIRLFIDGEKKAIFAIVPDFKPDSLEATIAGYETKNKDMIKIWRKYFNEQKASVSPPSASELKAFISSDDL